MSSRVRVVLDDAGQKFDGTVKVLERLGIYTQAWQVEIPEVAGETVHAKIRRTYGLIRAFRGQRGFDARLKMWRERRGLNSRRSLYRLYLKAKGLLREKRQLQPRPAVRAARRMVAQPVPVPEANGQRIVFRDGNLDLNWANQVIMNQVQPVPEPEPVRRREWDEENDLA